jgi:hypothetical protein
MICAPLFDKEADNFDFEDLLGRDPAQCRP